MRVGVLVWRVRRTGSGSGVGTVVSRVEENGRGESDMVPFFGGTNSRTHEPRLRS